MKRTTCILAISALALTGCGSDGDERARTLSPAGGASTAASSDPAADVESDGGGGRTLTEAELAAALLAVTDLPTGYSVDTAADEDEDQDGPTGSSGSECADKFAELDDDEDDVDTAQAEVSFVGGFGIVLEQEISSFTEDDEGKIDEGFDKLTEVLNDCPSFSSTDGGVTTEFTVGALSFPKLGDDTVALAFTGKSADFEIALNVVAVKVGRNLMFVSQGGLTTDAAVLEQAARKGVEKLAAAAD